MPQKLNSSEEFVHWLCRRTFLSLWSYASPRGKKGKELCDILIVCEPDIVIISVKEISVKNSSAGGVAASRWSREAIAGSVKQIYGAERHLSGSDHVIRADGSDGLPLPQSSSRRIHRIAVAFGSEGDIPYTMGDFGKGFVHVMDERSIQIVLSCSSGKREKSFLAPWRADL